MLAVAVLISVGTTTAAAATPDPAPRSLPTPQPIAWLAPIVAPIAKPAPFVPPPWTGSYDVYRVGSFVTQKTDYWCVGASIQMMVNIVRKTSDSSYATQAADLAYARAHEIEPASKPGSDPRGWANALTHFGAGAYKDATFSSMNAALAFVAKRIRLTGKPVGLTVGAGSHAWVMTGFVANRDPAVTNNFSVSAVYISGPLYPNQVARYGYFDLKPDTRLSRDQMAQVFTPYREPQGWSGWTGKWVVVAP